MIFILRKTKLLSLLFIILAVALCGCQGVEKHSAHRAKYVFLLIGDGFGPNQHIVGEAAIGRQLTMHTLPVRVIQGTDNAMGKTTDSAASGTALASGVKTLNGMVGMTPKKQPIPSLAMLLHQKGIPVGMISSSHLTDATPAAHYAHALNRIMQDKIGRQMAQSGFPFFGGAGGKFQYMSQAGYEVLEGAGALEKLQPGKKYFVNLPPYVEWQKEPASNAPSHTLAQYLRQAIKVLDSPQGFFIMLENGHIDYAGHDNDAGKLVREVRAFDEAVAVALDFARKHPKETLVVVTADHETGGLLMLSQNGDFNSEDRSSFNGDAAQLLWKQQQSRRDILGKVRQCLKANPKAHQDGSAIALLEESLGIAFTDQEQRQLSQLGPDAGKLVQAAFLIRDRRCGMNFTRLGHSSAPVPLYAYGAGAKLFTAPMENSHVPARIAQAMGDDEALQQILANGAENPAPANP